MTIISIALLVVFVVAAIIMILVILLQDDQGEGLSGMFGGGGTTPVGSRSGNVLTRFTSILAAIFIVGAFALAWLNRTPESSDILQRARAERLKSQEAQNWWVERAEPSTTPAPGAEGTLQPASPPSETAPADSASDMPASDASGAQGAQPAPESMNR
jgi:preprotein translocase subunit SecG